MVENYLFILKCIDGGSGWGKTGQIGYMIITADNIINATANLMKQIPGGWIFDFICITLEQPRLCTDIFSKLENPVFKEI